jgi:hypothetical protein
VEALLLMLDGLALILVVFWTARAMAVPPGKPPAGLFAWREVASPARKGPARRSDLHRKPSG